ncbi:unnamed protein product [Arctogadus glacialis]
MTTKATLYPHGRGPAGGDSHCYPPDTIQKDATKEKKGTTEEEEGEKGEVGEREEEGEKGEVGEREEEEEEEEYAGRESDDWTGKVLPLLGPLCAVFLLGLTCLPRGGEDMEDEERWSSPEPPAWLRGRLDWIRRLTAGPHLWRRGEAERHPVCLPLHQSVNLSMKEG